MLFFRTLGQYRHKKAIQSLSCFKFYCISAHMNKKIHMVIFWHYRALEYTIFCMPYKFTTIIYTISLDF
jgi:hypothetical protein